jgi:hypothetical protein
VLGWLAFLECLDQTTLGLFCHVFGVAAVLDGATATEMEVSVFA